MVKGTWRGTNWKNDIEAIQNEVCTSKNFNGFNYKKLNNSGNCIDGYKFLSYSIRINSNYEAKFTGKWLLCPPKE
jgi:hypothetical protein